MSEETLDSFIEVYNKDILEYVKSFLQQYNIRDFIRDDVIFLRLSEHTPTVNDSDIKFLIKEINKDIEDYLNRGENCKLQSSVFIDVKSLIGKEMGWSAIYKLINNIRGDIIFATNIYVKTEDTYTVVSAKGIKIPYLQKIQQLVQLKDEHAFSVIEFYFKDTLDYLETPQYIGDMLSLF
jgi:hypothetical protein